MERDVLVPIRPIPELDVRETDRIYWDPATSQYPLPVRSIQNTGRVLAAIEAGWLRPEFTPAPLAESRVVGVVPRNAVGQE